MPPIPNEVFGRIANNPAFVDELLVLKAKLGADRLIVNVSGYRDTL
jgi:hypothetical protein